MPAETKSLNKMSFEEQIQNLLDDSKVVTYRILSSKLQVHVNVSKRMLFTFLDKNRESLNAMYFVCGKTKEGTHNKLVSEENKTEFVKQFDEIICEHVYAIAKKSENGLTSAECYRADQTFRKNGGFDVNLRAIKNENYSVRENRFQSDSVQNEPEANLEPKSSVAMKQNESKMKSKNTTLTQMFAKNSTVTKKEVNKDAKNEKKFVKPEETPKNSSNEKKGKPYTISQRYSVEI